MRETSKMPDDAPPAWAEGYRARVAGFDRPDNPFRDAGGGYE
jgi:hypothetical protein